MSESCPFQFDLMNPQTYNDTVPYDAFKTLREKCPVSLQDGWGPHGKFWSITKREHLDFISKNPAMFSSAENGSAPIPDPTPEKMEASGMILINMDPPNHIKYRRVVKNAFTARAIDKLEPLMKQTAKNIVDQVAARGHCDFVSEVAAEMPLFVICALMELPDDRRLTFSRCVDVILGADDPGIVTEPDDVENAAAELFGMAMELAEKHRNDPQEGTIIHALLNGTVEGEILNEIEFCSFFLLLVVGAVETTRTATSQGMRLLIEHPEQMQKLIDDPSLIPGAIEEILRFYTPFIFMQRTAMEDVELDGMQIKKGDIVRLHYPSVNREKETFGDDADVFDVTRAQRMPDLRTQHRAFGIGQHFCLGSHLARKELIIMFEEFIPRLRNPQLAEKPNNLMSNFIVAVKEMKITFDPETAAI